MKIRTELRKILCYCGIGIIVAFSFVSICQAKVSDDGVTWFGHQWSEDPSSDVERSLVLSFITAYIESSTLYIQNDKPNGAIDIAIVSEKSGVVVWEQVVPEAATALVVIPLEGLPSGSYSLQLVNEWGGYLCGLFRK